jgi:hypothetical protein
MTNSIERKFKIFYQFQTKNLNYIRNPLFLVNSDQFSNINFLELKQTNLLQHLISKGGKEYTYKLLSQTTLILNKLVGTKNLKYYTIFYKIILRITLETVITTAKFYIPLQQDL